MAPWMRRQSSLWRCRPPRPVPSPVAGLASWRRSARDSVKVVRVLGLPRLVLVAASYLLLFDSSRVLLYKSISFVSVDEVSKNESGGAEHIAVGFWLLYLSACHALDFFTDRCRSHHLMQ
ncbi:uncharacterized protein LOC124659937 [Lolium rigidum]|uniref:uncharacterized protein LOC124659937 n=1 Tax=Lolium rigidum TaxID=89674 RepID=UPI001F5D508A|nr:uncharacterized protein LOC124659937 [Lolium rigidum]